MNRTLWRLGVVYLSVVALIGSFVGCEDFEPDTDAASDLFSDEAFAFFDSSWLVITASGAAEDVTSGNPTLPDDGDRLTLQASGGTPPYSWSMRYPMGGEFTGTGDTIIYRRLRQGDNVITLTDASGNIKYIVIEQPYEEYDLSISPATKTLNDDNETFQLTAVGGRPPYTWGSFSNDVGQLIGAQGNTTIVYQRLTDGDNVISVTDADGLIAFCLVSQPLIEPLIIIPPTVDVIAFDTIQFAAAGGVPPYVWTVGNAAAGSITASGLYTNTATQVNIIYVFDSKGSSTNATTY